VKPLDVVSIARNILNIIAASKFRVSSLLLSQNEAILNATKINLPSLSERGGGLIDQSRQIRKLKPWLDKIRNFKKTQTLSGMKHDSDDSDDELG